jgi:hypothetical protein
MAWLSDIPASSSLYRLHEDQDNVTAPSLADTSTQTPNPATASSPPSSSSSEATPNHAPELASLFDPKYTNEYILQGLSSLSEIVNDFAYDEMWYAREYEDFVEPSTFSAPRETWYYDDPSFFAEMESRAVVDQYVELELEAERPAQHSDVMSHETESVTAQETLICRFETFLDNNGASLPASDSISEPVPAFEGEHEYLRPHRRHYTSLLMLHGQEYVEKLFEEKRGWEEGELAWEVFAGPRSLSEMCVDRLGGPEALCRLLTEGKHKSA